MTPNLFKMVIDSVIYTYGLSIDDVIDGVFDGKSLKDFYTIDHDYTANQPWLDQENLQYYLIKFITEIKPENYSVDPADLVDISNYDEIQANPLISFTINDIVERIRELDSQSYNDMQDKVIQMLQEEEEFPVYKLFNLNTVAGNLQICVNGNSGQIISSFYQQGDTDSSEDEHYNIALDTIESLVLAHACAGVDVSTDSYLEGLNTTLETLSNKL